MRGRGGGGGEGRKGRRGREGRTGGKGGGGGRGLGIRPGITTHSRTCTYICVCAYTSSIIYLHPYRCVVMQGTLCRRHPGTSLSVHAHTS